MYLTLLVQNMLVNQEYQLICRNTIKLSTTHLDFEFRLPVLWTFAFMLYLCVENHYHGIITV